MPKGNGNVKRNRIKRRLELHIPVAALSTNKMYAGQKRRSVYYKAFRKKIFNFLSESKEYRRNQVSLKGNLVLKMEVGFSSPLSDLSNVIKSIEDILVAFYDFDDRQIVRIEMDKVLVRKGDEYMDIVISQTRKKIDRRHSA